MHDVCKLLFELICSDALQNDAVTTRKLPNFLHPHIVTAICDAQNPDPLRMPGQRRPHRMQPKYRLQTHAKSSANSRSMSPSIGLTAVTTTLTFAPVCSL